MPTRSIAQPLPMDIRNWSFRGLDCQYWDFSRRDIRGCNFTNANLSHANFSGSIAGRSKIQEITYIIALVPLLLIDLHTEQETNIFSAANSARGFVFCVIISILVIIVAVGDLKHGRISESFLWTIFAIVLLGGAIYLGNEVIKQFKNEPGTIFQGAILESVNFTGATLNHCKFANAYLNDVNWDNVKGGGSDIDLSMIN